MLPIQQSQSLNFYSIYSLLIK